MPCSAVTLSLATISAIISVAFLSIAFTTDNWLTYDVKRNSIQVNFFFLSNNIDGGFFPIFFTVEEIQRILTFFLKTGRLFFDSFLKGSILIRINPLFRIHIHRNMNPSLHCILYICF